MEYSGALSVVVLVAILTYLLFPRWGRRKLPPGPYPFPIVGNIFQLGKKPHESLAKLSKTYGPLMSLQLGSTYNIVVSSPKIAKEVLQKHDHAFSGRRIPAAWQAHDHHKMSVAFMSVADQSWLKLRKLSKEQLFTYSRLQAGQSLRRERLQKLCAYIGDCCRSRRAVNIGEAAFVTTLNLMSAALFSAEVTTFDSNAATEEFRDMVLGFQKGLGSVSNFSDFFPVLQPLDLQGVNRAAQVYFGKLLAFFEDLINQRLTESMNKKIKKKTDLLQTLLDLRQEESNEYNFSNNLIKHFLLDMFAGGTDSTATTIEWAMTELLFNPDVLLKVKQEIKSIAGDDNELNESEIMQLPYLQAVMKETFRCHPPGPLLSPRKSEYGAKVCGYEIPKGTQMIVNAWAIGRDPEIWSEPESFQPERFLKSDGNNNNSNNIDFKGQDFELIPFGAGRRICPALQLASRMLHTTVATLIHNFDWKLVEGQDYKSENMFGLALHRVAPLMAVPIKPS